MAKRTMAEWMEFASRKYEEMKRHRAAPKPPCSIEAVAKAIAAGQVTRFPIEKTRSQGDL